MSWSQKDTLSEWFKNNLKINLAGLNDLCLNDTNMFQGSYLFTTTNDFNSELQKLNLPFFNKRNSRSGLVYNYLDTLNTLSKQNLVKCFSFYENEFEGALKFEGLPVEFKYLAPAISAMNPNASHNEYRAGLFQLSHFQAKLNGLTVNRLVDERFNPYYSVVAAARELRKNMELFKNPEVALAACILGKTKVQNAICLAKDNETEIWKFLPDQFYEIQSVFQAMAVFLTLNKFKWITDKFPEEISPDTVWIDRELHFRQVSDIISIPLNQIRFYNPQFIFSIIPGNEKSTKLLLPKGKWDDFVLWQDSIYNSYDSVLFQPVVQKIEYPPAPNGQYTGEPVKDLEIEGKTKIKYRLKTGDVLGIIAEKYDVRVADLKYWNNIFNERRIQAGKYLDIFVDDDKADYYGNLAAEKSNKGEETTFIEKIQKQSSLKALAEINGSRKVEHVVKSGESPFVIAKKYDGVTVDEILEWNNIDDARKIQIGQVLILYLK